MPDPTHILNLTQDKEGGVHLHADRSGLDELIKKLQRLRSAIDKDICEHDHLMTSECAGEDLSSKNGIMPDGHHLVHHLKIFGWTDEWTKKNGFR